MAGTPEWSGQQLAEFLSVVASYTDEASAIDGAVELAAIGVEAEVAAVVRDGEVLASIGFRRGRVPADVLVEAAAAGPASIDLPELGTCHAVVVPLDDERPARIVLARTLDPFTAEDVALLRGMARVLTLTLRPLRHLEVERALRVQSEVQAEENRRLLTLVQERRTFLERLNAIERAISHRVPIQEVFDAIAGGAAEVLGHEVAILRILDEHDPTFARTVASVGRPARGRRERRLPIADSLGGQAIEEGRLVVARRYADSPRAVASVVDDGIVSAMAAPVYRDGVVAGSLLVASRTPQPYTAAEQETLLSFAEHVSLALNDVSALEAMRKAYADAVHQAGHDPLTGLPNRSLAVERLQHALAQRARTVHDVAVLFVDLDRFKSVNDSFGHAVGDEVLIRVADRLRSAVRPGDTVARLAGDEFVVICADLDPVGALQVAQRITSAIAEPLPLYGRETVITASVGVTRADSSRSADEVLRDADVAMYRAKERGRSRIELFDEAMRTRILERVETEQSLRRAVGAGELVVHYQPIFDARTGAPVGVEALVRWDRPGVGLVPPDRFIPIAEEAGFIVAIGRWVLEQACLQVAAWRLLDPTLRRLRLNVNLSARQFTDADLLRSIAAALDRADLPGSALALEITESVLMEDVVATAETLSSLKALGVRLSIDDFGTGYSSLAYLKRFTVDELKVDRSFVRGLGEDAEDDAIVRAVLGLARALGLEVVAEGVETRAQLDLLAALGCHAVQGFLLGRPQPPVDVTPVLVPRLRVGAMSGVPGAA